MSLAVNQPATPTRSSTGLSLLSKIRSHKDHHLTQPRPDSQRSSSYGSPSKTSPRSSSFSLPAQEGAGVKARRLSTQPRDDFICDTINLDEEYVSASKLGRSKKCGSGSSCNVKVMVKRSDKHGQHYAVKEFRKRSTRDTEDEYVAKVKSEYTMAKALCHPNIVKTVGLATYHGRWDHVMEYCGQGDVFSLLERRCFKPEDRNCIFKQVLRGVAFLHDSGIAHRDIKLENCLMSDDGHVKVTDFGVSEVFRGDHPGLLSSRGQCMRGNISHVRMSKPGVVGSKPYIAPEVLAKDEEYDPSKLDVWSCGILFLTLMLNGNPWQSASKKELNYQLFSDGWTTFLARCPDDPLDENNHPQCGSPFNALTNSQRRCILRMLHPDPRRRCTIDDALHDRWVRVIDCCSPAPGTTNGIDVSKDCSKAMSKMKVQAKHDHLPAPVKRSSFIQHRFDMGDGTSRYD